MSSPAAGLDCGVTAGHGQSRPPRDDAALLIGIKTIVKAAAACAAPRSEVDGLSMEQRVSLLIAVARGAMDLRAAQLRVVGASL